jgi:hypothetical protein
MASSNIIVQSIVDDQKHGRVLSLFVMARRGIESLGSLLFGHHRELDRHAQDSHDRRRRLSARGRGFCRQTSIDKARKPLLR